MKECVPQLWASACGVLVTPCTSSAAVEVARKVEISFLLLGEWLWGNGVVVVVVVEGFLCLVLMWAWRSVVA